MKELFEDYSMPPGAVISECGKYRYALWRIWNKTVKNVMFIMLNPSTADHTANDATIRRCIGFAKSWGYGGILIGNLFAWRDRNPEALYTNRSKGLDIVGPENDRMLMKLAISCDKIVFAWGNDGGLMGRNEKVINLFPDAVCLGLTRCGHPAHPLFLKGDTQLIPFKK